jgi:hypothetical protein
MLNQAPIVVRKHNLHIASNSRHIRSGGFGVSSSPGSSANITRNASEVSPIRMNRIEQNMLDSIYGKEAEKEKRIAKRGKVANLRHRRTQSQQEREEDSVAAEVDRQRKNRVHMVKSSDSLGGSPAAAPGPAPALAPMASPASAPQVVSSPFHMDEDMGAAEQGFSGDLVEHDNMKTATKDWHVEYGPGAHGLQDYIRICRLYPDNQWCRDRGYHSSTPAPKSAALRPGVGNVLAIILVASCGIHFAQ